MEGGIAATLILFEKYKVIDIVYESDTVTIYKTEHVTMSVKRIVKRILKNSVCKDTFYSEVNILKNIKNPNIPILYDVEEDGQAYYIIEDYIEGTNLDELIRIGGTMSERQAVDIGLKLCHIISFLHNQKPVPVLYLDIQPKNIIINDEELYLVDFGNSHYSDKTEERALLMGTIGYAAPEQYKREVLDERTDIYGIGAVLYYLVTGNNCDGNKAQHILFPHNISEKFKIVIWQCLALDRKDRFSSVGALEGCLTNIFSEDNICTCNEKSHIISFVGTDRRVGVTHVCLAFASYLASQGYKVLYEEANSSNHLRSIAADKRWKYQNGFFYAGTLKCKPLYGAQVNLDSECTYILRDCGIFSEENICKQNLTNKSCDYNETKDDKKYVGVKLNNEALNNEELINETLVLVAGAKPWEIDLSVKVWNKVKDMADNEKITAGLHLLCNGASHNEALVLWNRTGFSGQRVPLLQHIFEYEGYDDIEKQFLEGLKSVLIAGDEGGEVHRKTTGFFGKASRKAAGCIHRYFRRS